MHVPFLLTRADLWCCSAAIWSWCRIRDEQAWVGTRHGFGVIVCVGSCPAVANNSARFGASLSGDSRRGVFPTGRAN
ncbi:hypothetical protein RRG08_012059 [Elysia crispata]|uniref:Secreted protein n=1 Tax=Elysia crispata TaxID=231223 RepID=A0AAE1ALK6_9GAST|nr:hypothetical protein RRG08_012059 [Elysia crispata]